ncbi:hypothetical protein GCM10023165_42410 [Variovorax defluvii]|uniref:Uncharacterized protein n=2 Tax=Variovorax defluvii TaxID=913761 RepID=A0ABP8I736_9BURK
MDAILLLITVNFLSVPFLQEAEAQGLRLRRFPDVMRILRLAHVRKCRWLWPFSGLTLCLVVFALPRLRGDDIERQLTLALHTLIMQSLLWSVVFINVRRQARASRRQQDAFDAKAHTDGGSLLRRP